jgi:glycosyltransferase involved in cell wall biosynthesis
MAKWNLIIYAPAYNVERSISEFLLRINVVAKSLENSDVFLKSVIIINDGSNDSTASILAGLRRKLSYLKIVNKKKNEGPARAIFDGIEESLKIINESTLITNRTIIVRMDSDLEHQPEDIPKLIQPIVSDKAQISVGYIKFDSRSGRLSKLFNELIGLWESREFLGLDIPQFCPGFTAMRGDTFYEILPILKEKSTEFLKKYGKEMLALDFMTLAIAAKLSKKIMPLRLGPIESRHIKKSPIEKYIHYFLHHSDISNFLRRSV